MHLSALSKLIGPWMGMGLIPDVIHIKYDFFVEYVHIFALDIHWLLHNSPIDSKSALAQIMA